MNTNNATSTSLKYCLLVGIALMSAGLIFSEYDFGDRIMWAGLILLLGSPFVGVIVTCVHLMKEKDRKWVNVSIVLIAVIIAGIILSVIR